LKSSSSSQGKKDPAVYGYLASEQALADYAELITYLKVSIHFGFRLSVSDQCSGSGTFSTDIV
jgi:hypothetical protein